MMRKTLFLFSGLLLCGAVAVFGQQTEYPFQNQNLPVEERVEDLVSRMTLEEKIDLLAGYNDFYLHPCERLGIPAFKMADGPLGLSSWGLWGRATAFPAALAVAASWDCDLVARLGAAYAEEWRARGIHFMLAPGVNMYRASKGARNFEYYGEDPYLTSALVVPFIQAVQDGGVIATVKHFAGNDQEFDRYRVSTEVSERTLREIYLPPFKAAVDAGVKAVMTGYNPVNGVYCTENKYLIDILKNEWGFKGMLMSDWACTYSADKAANHGLDLEMGSKSWFNREKLLPLVRSGEVPESVIDDKVRRIYGTCLAMGFFDRPQQRTDLPVYNPKANRMALEAAEQGVVLLKNDGLLPLEAPKKIAVIGPTANPALINDRVFSTNGIVYGGGGSSRVHPWYVVNDLQGITDEFPEAEVYYHEGISNSFKRRLFASSRFRTKDGRPGLEARYSRIGNQKQHAVSDRLMAEQAKAAGRATEDSRSATGSNQESGEAAVLQRIDGQVNFEWWGSPHNESRLGDDYEAVWEGFVDVQHTDSLRFFVDAQGAYRLYLDGRLVLDASDSQSFTFGQAALAATRGEALSVRLEFRNRRSAPAEIRMGYCYDSDLDFSEPKRLAAAADVVVFCAGLDGSIELEGRDRPFDLPYGQDRLISELLQVNPNLVVVLHAGGGVNMTQWIDRVPAVLHAFYPGQEGGHALGHILSGRVNPSAKLPFTIERRWADSPSAGNYDETRSERKIYYREGIFMGYRGYEHQGVKPLFPFGYGLSYTTFAYGDLEVDVADKRAAEVEARISVTNTGKRAGAEIVQFYISDPKSAEPRPLKELKGFGKVWLEPGETKTVTVRFDKEDFQYFSEKKHRWVFEKGRFEIHAGASSADIRSTRAITL